MFREDYSSVNCYHLVMPDSVLCNVFYSFLMWDGTKATRLIHIESVGRKVIPFIYVEYDTFIRRYHWVRKTDEMLISIMKNVCWRTLTLLFHWLVRLAMTYCSNMNMPSLLSLGRQIYIVCQNFRKFLFVFFCLFFVFVLFCFLINVRN